MKLIDDKLLEQLIKAMKTGHSINIRYRQYGSPQSYWTGADPYCLELFHQKWYLLGRLFDNKYVMFCLNMIEEVKMQQHTFKMDKNFYAADFFDPYFGVDIDEELPTPEQKVANSSIVGITVILKRSSIKKSKSFSI